jgi:hypothetical protein
MPTLSVQPLHRGPPELTDDMTKQDLLEVLENLSWGHGSNSCLLRLDRGVVVFLMRLLRGR